MFLGHLHFDHAGGLCDVPGCAAMPPTWKKIYARKSRRAIAGKTMRPSRSPASANSTHSPAIRMRNCGRTTTLHSSKACRHFLLGATRFWKFGRHEPHGQRPDPACPVAWHRLRASIHAPLRHALSGFILRCAEIATEREKIWILAAALTRAHEASAAAAICKALVIMAMMGAQRIHAEIGDWIAPHGVHMIGIACGVVVLDQ